MKVCPACQYQNREGVLFCDDCGEPLRNVPSTQTHRLEAKEVRIGGSNTALKTSHWGTARFGPKASIIFSVKDVSEQVVVTPAEQIVVGRMDMTTKTSPNVDLSPFGAQEKGVSRMHATIVRNDESLLITDLGSMNGTFVNGQRLQSGQSHLLHDGDELRFGRLALRVFFRAPTE